jgi:hypothetical protein
MKTGWQGGKFKTKESSTDRKYLFPRFSQASLVISDIAFYD